jgi:purine-binding chemotaxis protein CheW
MWTGADAVPRTFQGTGVRAYGVMEAGLTRGGPTQQYVSFRIDDHLMGIDIGKIREVNLLLDITPVQHAPAHVRGLINLRGQIVTVLDLGVRLGLAAREITGESHNVILKHEDVGLLVDNIGDVVEVGPADIMIPPANMDLAVSTCVESVVRMENGLMMVLSPEMILDGPDAFSEPPENR